MRPLRTHGALIVGLLSLLTASAVQAGSCDRAFIQFGIWPPAGALPTRPLLLLDGSLGTAEKVAAFGRGIEVYLVAADHAVPLMVTARYGEPPIGSFRGQAVELRPTRPLAPHTRYELLLVQPDGRVRMPHAPLSVAELRGPRGQRTPPRPYAWTTADGPDTTPPRVVGQATPRADRADLHSSAPSHHIEFDLPTADDGWQFYRVSLRERPHPHGATGRDIDPRWRTFPTAAWRDHFRLAQGFCRQYFDVFGARSFEMTLVAVDMGGNATAVAGAITFDGIDPRAERDLHGRHERHPPP